MQLDFKAIAEHMAPSTKNRFTIFPSGISMTQFQRTLCLNMIHVKVIRKKKERSEASHHRTFSLAYKQDSIMYIQIWISIHKNNQRNHKTYHIHEELHPRERQFKIWHVMECQQQELQTVFCKICSYHIYNYLKRKITLLTVNRSG